MVKSVIGGFQKITKRKKNYFDDLEDQNNKKNKKQKRKKEKISYEDTSPIDNSFDDDMDYDEEYEDDETVQYAIVIETSDGEDAEEDFRRLKEHTDPVNVFIDVDSLNEMNLYNRENALEYVKSQVMMIAEDKPNINWVSFSLKEQMQIITSTSEEQAEDDVGKAD